MLPQRKVITMATITALTAGLSTVFLGIAPANATVYTCAYSGTLLPGGMCELTYTTPNTEYTFTPPADTTRMEALLVGGGGIGAQRGGGGGFARDTGDPYTVVDATLNTGGGGSSVELEPESDGSSGVIVVRWKTASASAVTFTTNGHGATVPNQEVATGTTAVKPVDPSAAGFIFNGWYTDSALTTAANFATPIAADTTLYASWSVLASTGVNINPLAIPGAVGVLMLGMMLMLLARRRRLHP